MPKRILVAAMHHESNSFNPIIADREDFTLAFGKEIFDILRPNDSLSGIVYTLLGMGWEVVPLLSARAVPNGEISRPLYDELKADLIRRAKDARETGPVDGIVLSLHGSMRIQGLGKAEGDILAALREIYPEVPLFSSLDMHTTMSEQMHQLCDGFVGYKCAPHIDCSETGAHAARLAIAALTGTAKPVSAWCRIPMLIAGEKSETNTEPMKTLIKALRESEAKPGILAASYLMGFPWADHDNHSVSVYVVADGDPALAEAEAAALADLFWSYRNDFSFHTDTYPPKEALDAAFEIAGKGEKPLYVSDSGDNPTAGSSGDCTGLLELFLDHPRTLELNTPVLFGGIYDPAAAAACRGRVGEEITLNFGAAFDKKTTRRLQRTGRVKAHLESWGDYGCEMALFSIGNVDLVLLSKHIGYIGPEMFRALGAEPAERDIVVCKLGYLTDPHRRVAARSIMALSSGSTNEDLSTVPYTKINRPIYPLDRNIEFSGIKGIRRRK